MATEINMPKFGLSMEAGIIGTWLVNEGDKVSQGDQILEVETDKITNTVESPVDGVVRKFLFEEGDEVPCGELVCIIGDENEDINSYTNNKRPDHSTEEEVNEIASVTITKKEVKITPRARKIAEEKGIDYSNIVGTGIHQMITIDDLRRYEQNKPKEEIKVVKKEVVVEEKKVEVKEVVKQVPVRTVEVPVGANDVVVKMNNMQKVISNRMYESLQTTAQTTVSTEVEVTNLSKVYQGLKNKYTNVGLKLSYTAMIIKSVAQALEDHPKLRSMMVDDNHIKISNDINIGVAIDIEQGLVVPVIKNANLKDLRTICMELSELTQKAKLNQLSKDEMSDGVITITNLGMFGITYFTPVLNAPESSILGIGAIIEKVMVKDNMFYAGKAMNMSLTIDHRVIDGAPASRFLQDITKNLLDFKWA